MSNFYSNPGESGLEPIAEIDFSDGNYCFDLRIVWMRLADRKLLSGRDSGCSCPSPFQDMELKDLQEVESTSWLREEIRVDDRGNVSASAASAFLEKVEAALKRPNWGGH